MAFQETAEVRRYRQSEAPNAGPPSDSGPAPGVLAQVPLAAPGADRGRGAGQAKGQQKGQRKGQGKPWGKGGGGKKGR